VVVQSRCRGEEVQRFSGGAEQVWRCRGAQRRCRGGALQRCRGVEVQVVQSRSKVQSSFVVQSRCRAGAVVQWCSGAVVHGAADVQNEGWKRSRVRGAEVQVHQGAE